MRGATLRRWVLVALTTLAAFSMLPFAAALASGVFAVSLAGLVSSSDGRARQRSDDRARR